MVRGGNQWQLERLRRNRRPAPAHSRVPPRTLSQWRYTRSACGRALRSSTVCHAYRLDLLRASIRFGLWMLFGRRGLGQTCSNSISPRRWAAISFIASTRSCPKLGFFDAGRMTLPVSRNLRVGFCDVDCDVTLLRIGENDRFCVVARPCAAELTATANASEAPQFQELRRHSRSSPLTGSHTTRPIHTQEVTGSSPVAPTIRINNIQTRWLTSYGSTPKTGEQPRSEINQAHNTLTRSL